MNKIDVAVYAVSSYSIKLQLWSTSVVKVTCSFNVDGAEH